MIFFITMSSVQILGFASRAAAIEDVHLLYERPAKLDWKNLQTGWNRMTRACVDKAIEDSSTGN
jgi:hypothetical protein